MDECSYQKEQVQPPASQSNLQSAVARPLAYCRSPVSIRLAFRRFHIITSCPDVTISNCRATGAAKVTWTMRQPVVGTCETSGIGQTDAQAHRVKRGKLQISALPMPQRSIRAWENSECMEPIGHPKPKKPQIPIEFDKSVLCRTLPEMPSLWEWYSRMRH